MASPHVAGAAALVLSECTFTTAQLKANLMDNVVPIAALAGITVTGGRLNVNNSIRDCGTVPDPPAAPTGLVATAGVNQVTLNWNAVAGATSYNVKRSTTPGGPYGTIASGVGSTTYIDAPLAGGTTLYYVVSAVMGRRERQLLGSVSHPVRQPEPAGGAHQPPGSRRQRSDCSDMERVSRC